MCVVWGCVVLSCDVVLCVVVCVESGWTAFVVGLLLFDR